MNWIRALSVLALVALWLPASSHALLQHTGLIHNDIEHHHHDGKSHNHGPADAKDHDAADGICRVESHHAKVPCPVFAVVFLVPDCASNVESFFVPEPDHSGPSPPGTAPPRPSGPRAPPLA